MNRKLVLCGSILSAVILTRLFQNKPPKVSNVKDHTIVINSNSMSITIDDIAIIEPTNSLLSLISNNDIVRVVMKDRTHGDIMVQMSDNDICDVKNKL